MKVQNLKLLLLKTFMLIWKVKRVKIPWDNFLCVCKTHQCWIFPHFLEVMTCTTFGCLVLLVLEGQSYRLCSTGFRQSAHLEVSLSLSLSLSLKKRYCRYRSKSTHFHVNFGLSWVCWRAKCTAGDQGMVTPEFTEQSDQHWFHQCNYTRQSLWKKILHHKYTSVKLNIN